NAINEFSKDSSLVPNLDKSVAFFGNVPSHNKRAILRVMAFAEGSLLIKYLGVPLISSILYKKFCDPLIDKVMQRLINWKNKGDLQNEAGGKDRPPMLAPDKVVPGSEGSPETTTERYMETYKNVSQDIRESINVQDLETNLYWEFGKFTSQDGESLKSYYPRFVTLVKQSQELKTISYHKLYDIMKQHQNEVNEIRAERIARTANLLALVAQQQPVYHPQNHPTHYTQNSSTKSQQAATRNRGKAIVNSPSLIYDQEPPMVAEEDEMETVGMTVVQKSRIQCYNCKEFGHVGREYWRDDTDDKSEDQELEAHYMYMAQIQEVFSDVANSEPIFDSEPLQKIDQNDDDNDLANERELLASLIEKLKCEINDNKNRNKFLETSNKVLVEKLKVQTINMLNHNCKTSFAKPEFLKKAQRANPYLYDIGGYNDNLSLMLAPESDEVIRLEKESKLKLIDLIRPFDYEKLNNIYDLFVPQRKKSSEQRYFSKRSRMSHTPVNNGNSKESFNKQTTLLEKRMDESILWDQKCKSSKELFKIKRSVGRIFDGVECCKETITKRTYFGHIDPFIHSTIEANFCPEIRRISADLAKFHVCLKEEMVADLRYFNSLELEVDSLKSQLETQKT
nr:hypothetical protein [Tanacetum cinerariifolium]